MSFDLKSIVEFFSDDADEKSLRDQGVAVSEGKGGFQVRYSPPFPVAISVQDVRLRHDH